VVNQRLLEHVDWALVVALMALCLLGMVTIYSATGGETTVLRTQGYALVLGLMAMGMAMFMDYRHLGEKSHLIYLGVLLLLVTVIFAGAVRGGARRWLDLGVFNLQPSEFAKVALALLLAKFLGDSERRRLSNHQLLLACVLTAVPMLLIARQPDLGTAVTLVPVLMVVTFAAGLPLRHFGMIVLVAALAAPIVYTFGLKDYQRSRIETFLDPERDPRGAGYQQIQARITVGAGGVWGEGFMKGNQAQLRFLPVSHNDFIFSVLAEEQGFLGVVAALGLYLFVILRSIDAARLAKDALGSYLVLGILSSFTFQVVYNITMSAGLVPVKGLTLPLMSYGGSSLIATLAAFGLVLNVRMRRFTN
jgi:rod shape determining protein RodA